jgi:hypothetical protein
MISTPTKTVEKTGLRIDSQRVLAHPPLRPRQTEPRAAIGSAHRTSSMPVPTGPPISVPVELWIETITDLDKICPCFAYVSPPQETHVTRLTIAFNLALWPTVGAVTRGDENALRWLAAMALTDRATTWPSHPVLHAAGRHFADLVDCHQGHQRGIWTAYSLRDHDLLRRIPDLVSTPSLLPTKFAEFTVSIDSIKLADFCSRMAKRTKKRPVMS